MGTIRSKAWKTANRKKLASAYIQAWLDRGSMIPIDVEHGAPELAKDHRSKFLSGMGDSVFGDGWQAFMEVYQDDPLELGRAVDDMRRSAEDLLAAAEALEKVLL